jgi:PadR family transcriptional regulator, regulatory protein AphA
VLKLTTTSYLILGHLALRDWSTYELAQQLTRSTRHYWPRAESKLYEEPKKLVQHGLATATIEHTGRRPRTVYAITDAGREALRRWLAEPAQPPLVEFEGMVKVLFAEHGTKRDLMATLRSIREQAERTRDEHAVLARDLVETGGPFPDRLHLNALVFRYMWDQADTIVRWATWAEQQVGRWPADITHPTGEDAKDTLRRTTESRD